MTPYEIRQIAVAALVDERTVRRYLKGLPIRELGRRRIEAAARRLATSHDDGQV